MIRYTSISNLRLIGGHPALDFSNTVVARTERYGPDLLRTFGDLVGWAVRAGVIQKLHGETLARKGRSLEAEARAALRKAKNLREAIHAVFSAHAGGQTIPPKCLAKLERMAMRARAASNLLAENNHFAWRLSEEADLDTVCHLVAEAATDLLTKPSSLKRVRECPGQNCGWLFLDTSRGGRRKWCSEEDCGTLARVRRHRSRESGRRSAPKDRS